jgi:hypothetical protein
MFKKILNKRLFFLFGSLLLLGQLTTVKAEPMTLTFDNLPAGPINGKIIQSTLFQFTLNGIPSADALLNTGTTSTPQNFIACPCLEGNASGILTLNFLSPTPLVKFGVALTTTNNLVPGFTVDLYDEQDNLINSSSVNTVPATLSGFSEGEFNYNGQWVSKAVINFNERGLAFPLRRFAFDNLTTNPVPEPTTIVLLGVGILGIARKIVKSKAN